MFELVEQPFYCFGILFTTSQKLAYKIAYLYPSLFLVKTSENIRFLTIKKNTKIKFTSQTDIPTTSKRNSII